MPVGPMAKEAETSSWATSAAQDRRKAPPTIPSPMSAAANTGSRCAPDPRRMNAGTPKARQAPSHNAERLCAVPAVCARPLSW